MTNQWEQLQMLADHLVEVRDMFWGQEKLHPTIAELELQPYEFLSQMMGYFMLADGHLTAEESLLVSLVDDRYFTLGNPYSDVSSDVREMLLRTYAEEAGGFIDRFPRS